MTSVHGCLVQFDAQLESVCKFPAIAGDISHRVIVSVTWVLDRRPQSSSSGPFLFRHACVNSKINFPCSIVGDFKYIIYLPTASMILSKLSSSASLSWNLPESSAILRGKRVSQRKKHKSLWWVSKCNELGGYLRAPNLSVFKSLKWSQTKEPPI